MNMKEIIHTIIFRWYDCDVVLFILFAVMLTITLYLDVLGQLPKKLKLPLGVPSPRNNYSCTMFVAFATSYSYMYLLQPFTT
jgi:hypothetical protein